MKYLEFYEAFDGTRFDDEEQEDCITYEMNLLLDSGELLIFDNKFRKLENAWEPVDWSIIVCYSQLAIEIIKDWYNYQCEEAPWEASELIIGKIYFWDELIQSWTEYNKRISDINRQLRMYMEARKKCKDIAELVENNRREK